MILAYRILIELTFGKFFNFKSHTSGYFEQQRKCVISQQQKSNINTLNETIYNTKILKRRKNI